MLLLTEVAPILLLDRAKKTEKEGKQHERDDNEAKFDLSRYGIADLTGLPDRIRAWQATPVFKFKSKYPSGESVAERSSCAK